MSYSKMVGLPGRPRIDQAAFTGPFGEAVKHLGQHSEADEAGLLFYLLSAYSAMLGRGVRVRVGQQRNDIRIWTTLLGRTGIGRKGTAVREIDSLLDFVDPQFMGMNVYNDLTSAEGLIVDWQDPIFDADGVPKAGREDKRLLIVVEELVSLMSTGGKLLPTLRSVWDGKNLYRLTAKDGMAVVTKPHGVLHGHATPEEFALRLRRGHLAGGTYNRFLFALVDMSQIVDFARYGDEEAYHKKTEAIAETLRDNLRKMQSLGTPQDPLVLDMTPSAKKIYSAFYHKYVKDTDSGATMIEQFTARLPACAKMVAGLYCSSQGRKIISDENMLAGLAVAQYSPDSIEYLHGTLSGTAVEEDPKQRLVFDALKLAGANGLSRQEITHGILKRNSDKDEVNGILNALKTVPRARYNPETKKSSAVYTLPEYAEKASAEDVFN